MHEDNSSFWTDIKTFEEQLEKSPDSYCFARLSDVYLKVGLLDDALHAARQGVARHPGFLAGLRSLAMACHAKGLNDECLVALGRVTEAMPEDHQAQKLFGRLLADSGDLDAARQAFKTVLDFIPDDVECRIELEALEFSGGLAHPSPHVDEIGDEEIIENLEILEELDVFEEDQSVPELFDQGPFSAPEPTAELRHDPLSTVTLAELYVKQGFHLKALEIYRSILADDPGNRAVSTRIAELELHDTSAVESEAAFEDTFEFEPDESPASDYEAKTPFREVDFDVVPDSGTLSGISMQKEAVFTAPPEYVTAVVIPQGTADNALSTLEGWLENIRRARSCR